MILILQILQSLLQQISKMCLRIRNRLASKNRGSAQLRRLLHFLGESSGLSLQRLVLEALRFPALRQCLRPLRGMACKLAREALELLALRQCLRPLRLALRQRLRSLRA